jgi:PAS domain S-box-containing protein
VATSPTSEVELFSVAGHDGFLREVNEAFARLLGLDPVEVNGRSLLELVHPDDIGDIVAGLAALEAGAAQVLLENRFLQRDGRWVHLQWVARPVPGADLWWASGRDTTAFHRLLAERGILRAQLDLALGTATASMWELDIPAQMFTWEPQAAQILGVPADAVPVGVAELAAVVNPDDASELLAAVNGLAASGLAEVGIRVGTDAGLRHLSLRGKVLDRDRRGGRCAQWGCCSTSRPRRPWRSSCSA